MPQRLVACVLAVVLLAALPAGAHAAGVVRTTSVAATAVVPAGGTRTVGLECPSPSVALNGAVTRRDSGVELVRSVPGRAAGDWRFRFRAGGDGGRRVRAILRCARLDLPAGVSGARLQVKTGKRGVPVPAGSSAAVRLRCGPAFVATGYGFDAGASGDVRIASAVPRAHGWDFGLENTGTGPSRAGLSARCLRQTVDARRDGAPAELRFSVARPSFPHVIVNAGRPMLLHSCGAGQFSLATGFSVDPLDAVEHSVSGPVGRRGGRWTLRQASAGDRVRVFLTCLRTGSGFR